MWLLKPGCIRAKTDRQVTSELRFRHSTYAQKAKDITNLIKLTHVKTHLESTRIIKKTLVTLVAGITDAKQVLSGRHDGSVSMLEHGSLQARCALPSHAK
jgi:uncharacterized protein (DUF362 family)